MNQQLPARIKEDYMVSHGMQRKIRNVLQASTGAYVLAGPGGSGKSAMLREAMISFRRANPQRRVVRFAFFHHLRKNFLHDALGIPNWDSLSDYVPHGSVIILDSVLISKDAATAQNTAWYIKDIARNCNRSGKYTIIFVVSDPAAMKFLLHDDILREVALICNPADFKWSRAQQQEYITHNMADWSREDQDALLDIVEGAGTPGILKLVRDHALINRAWRAREYLPAPAKMVSLEWIADPARRVKASWEAFDAVFEEVRDDFLTFYPST
jgi:hypothetical protein